MGWLGHVDHASITMDRPRKSLRRWLPLQSLQGYFGLRDVWAILTSSTLPARVTVTGCFPTCLTVVGSLDPCLFFFFLFFLFFFFLFTELLALELSLDEEDGTEGELTSEEGEEDLTGEDGEGSTCG
jgi:hypothetical protein